MESRLFNKFLNNDDTLRVYEGGQLIFSSRKDRLLPLMEYIAHHAPVHQQVTIFDKIIGNAAALLSIKADCREVYSPFGSELAIKTLNKYGIKHHIGEAVPYIQKDDGTDMCPMEKLSLNREPEEFYAILKDAIK